MYPDARERIERLPAVSLTKNLSAYGGQIVGFRFIFFLIGTCYCNGECSITIRCAPLIEGNKVSFPLCLGAGEWIVGSQSVKYYGCNC